mmetsp:Transcript_111743/g.360725  ORF Transcript_111743/g.360725 Transcript_111743/m.360725 type:complete len:341 (+) Transcript_111743:59-1081(+)
MYNYPAGPTGGATSIGQYATYGATPGMGDGAAFGYSPHEINTMGVPFEKKQPFARGLRRRLNLLAIFISLFVPWGIFVLVFGMLSMPVHYNQPGATYFVIVLVFVGILVQGRYAYTSRLGIGLNNAEREPSWLVFLFLSLMVAFILGMVLGALNYKVYTLAYHQVVSLNDYQGVDPTRMRGQQLLDAGSVIFSNDTVLDLTRSMGFRNLDMFCVAPIIRPSSDPLPTYDFWAVGTNCCSGARPDFHCANYRNPRAHSAIRLLRTNDRPYYRLAVQQAESAYSIKAAHPLFFTWVEEPQLLAEKWRKGARTEFLVCMCSHLALQVFIVATAAVAFTKLGRF